MAVTVEGDFEDEVQDEQEVEVESVAEGEELDVADDQPEAEQQVEEQSDEVVVTIGEEAPPAEEHAPAPAWVKELRKANREKDRRIRELEAKLQPAAETKPALGKKPTLEDHDYDDEAYEAALSNWLEQKRKVDEHEAAQRAEIERQNQQFQQKVQVFLQKKAALRVPDYDDAEHVVTETLSQIQQGIIVSCADDAAALAYAIGKNPAKAQELAKIADPVQFAFAIAKLEAQVKVSPKVKAPPPPERRLSGSGAVSGSLEDKLEAARKKAEQTGDYSEVVRLRREARNKS